MKYLILKVVTIPGVSDAVLEKNPKADQFSYKAQLLEVIAIGEGMDAKEMRARLRILDVLDPADPGETVAFEDADHEKLAALVDRPIYIHFTRHLLRFIDDVKNARELPPVQSLNHQAQVTEDELAPVS